MAVGRAGGRAGGPAGKAMRGGWEKGCQQGGGSGANGRWVSGGGPIGRAARTKDDVQHAVVHALGLGRGGLRPLARHEVARGERHGHEVALRQRARLQHGEAGERDEEQALPGAAEDVIAGHGAPGGQPRVARAARGQQARRGRQQRAQQHAAQQVAREARVEVGHLDEQVRRAVEGREHPVRRAGHGAREGRAAQQRLVRAERRLLQRRHGRQRRGELRGNRSGHTTKLV